MAPVLSESIAALAFDRLRTLERVAREGPVLLAPATAFFLHENGYLTATGNGHNLTGSRGPFITTPKGDRLLDDYGGTYISSPLVNLLVQRINFYNLR